MDFVSCVAWVKRGVAKEVPDKVSLDKDELKRVIEESRQQLSKLGTDSFDDDDEENVKNENVEIPVDKPSTSEKMDVADETLSKYDLDNYDEEDSNVDHLASLAGLTYYATNDDDPYITIKDEDEDSEKEDFKIKTSDNLVVAGHVNGDMSTLEIYVYNEGEDSFYVHHDILLPSVPLCLEWMDFDNADQSKGNFLAVGNMTPVIDVWDIDMVDALEPAYQLGSSKKKKKKKKAKASKESLNSGGHTDAILALAWNRLVRNVIASGSADHTVKVWDMEKAASVLSLEDFTGNVQTLQFHPFESQALLSGSCDQSVRIYDCRSPETNPRIWTLNGEIERVIWNHHNPLYCLACTDAGFVYCLDPRIEKPLWTVSAHSASCTDISLSSQCPGCLVTISIDKTLKVWDIQDKFPVFIAEKDLKMGQLYCTQPCPDSAFILCAGGDKRSYNFSLVDLTKNPTVMNHFEKRPLKAVSTMIDTDASTSAMKE